MQRESSMNKRFSWVFLVLSGIFFFFMVGLTGYRIEDARQKNAAAARERLADLEAKAVSLRDSTGGFDAPQFKTDMRNVYDAEPRLLLLSIRSADQGFLYLVTRNKSLLKDPATPSPDWRGTPVYQVSKGYELLLTRQLEGSDASMDAVFVIMGREDLYPVVRDDLYLFLAFLLVCAVIMLIATGIQEEPARPASAPTPTPEAPVTFEALQPLRDQTRPSASAVPSEPAPFAARPEPIPEPAPVATDRPAAASSSDQSWLDYLEPRLQSELSRAQSSDLDLALARIRLDASHADARLPLVIAEMTRIIRESFPLHDMIFESGDDSCTILIPDTEIDAAVHMLDELRGKISGIPLEGRNRTISAGVSSRAGRLIDSRTLLEEANVSLAKASREGGNQVIGFRADAARFRETLTGSRT
jgi:GGDEF domain-containing protein